MSVPPINLNCFATVRYQGLLNPNSATIYITWGLDKLKTNSIITRLGVRDSRCHVINRLRQFRPFRVYNQISHERPTTRKRHKKLPPNTKTN